MGGTDNIALELNLALIRAILEISCFLKVRCLMMVTFATPSLQN